MMTIQSKMYDVMSRTDGTLRPLKVAIFRDVVVWCQQLAEVGRN